MRFTVTLWLVLLSRLAFANCTTAPTITSFGTPHLISISSDARSATWSVSTNVPTKALWYWAANASLYDHDSGDTDTAGATTHTYTISGLYPKSDGFPGQYGVGVRVIEIYNGNPCPRTDGSGNPLWKFSDPGTIPNLQLPSAPAGTFDYYAGVRGPQTVFQATSLYLGIQYLLLSGAYPHNKTRLQISGSPDFLSTVGLHWLDVELSGANSNKVASVSYSSDSLLPWSLPYLPGYELQIATSSSTPVGTYNLTLYACDISFPDCSQASGRGSNNVPTHSYPFVVNVLSPATFSFGTPTSYPPIPDLNPASRTSNALTFEETEAKYNSLWCAQDMHGTGWNPLSAGITCAADAQNGGRCLRQTDTDPKQWCAVGLAITWCSWFYDGEKMDYQWGLYTGQEDLWDNCRQGTEMVYRDGYMAHLTPPAGSNGILVFPHGYYLNWLSQGQLTDTNSNAGKSWNFIRNMGLNEAHGHPTGASSVMNNQRETAFAANVHHYAALVDPTLQTRGSNAAVLHYESWWETYYAEHVLGYLQQVCMEQSMPDYEPFMVGLQLDAVVRWYSVSRDLRVPVVVKACADYMYANLWNWYGDPHAFPYLYTALARGGYPSNSMANLNMIPVGAWGWLFSVTGDPTYQMEGDDIFQWGVKLGGPQLAWGIRSGTVNGNGGKQTSQMAYTSFDYIAWRTAPPASPISAVVPSTMTAVVNQPFTQSLTATGGYGPYTFDITQGVLPPGLTMAHNADATHGVISGTPTMAGTFALTVRAWDKFEFYSSDVPVVVTVTPF